MQRGVYHDLGDIYDRLNLAYFDNRIQAKVTWGRHRANSDGRKHSIRLGSYCLESSLITIHPVLDQASVPRLCVERIVYHEMLHQACPAKKISRDRRSIHTPEFRAAEARFIGAELADGWFKANLDRILHFAPLTFKSESRI
jgi:hypothetical protein